VTTPLPAGPPEPGAHGPTAPWPPGTATGVGSLPGAAVREAVRLVLDALPDLPHVPELPDRGPGAEMVGRTLALLPDLPAEWGPTGWTLTERAGRDARHAAALLREDLDTVEEELEGWSGPLKQQLCGPWTLAAAVELRSGRKALADTGAVRDLGQALAEAVGAHVADLGRRVPGARLLLQVDEPALPTVLVGGVPTPSGLAALPPWEGSDVQAALRRVVDALPAGVLAVAHCCGAAPPAGLLVDAGFAALSLDEGALGPADDDAVAEAVDRGTALLLGVAADRPDQAAGVVRARWRRTGQPAERVVEVAVTPPCGLAGTPPAQARRVLADVREAARILADDPEGRDG
jgi:methionine synthase II (cobalamin-independent)